MAYRAEASFFLDFLFHFLSRKKKKRPAWPIATKMSYINNLMNGVDRALNRNKKLKSKNTNQRKSGTNLNLIYDC